MRSAPKARFASRSSDPAEAGVATLFDRVEAGEGSAYVEVGSLEYEGPYAVRAAHALRVPRVQAAVDGVEGGEKGAWVSGDSREVAANPHLVGGDGDRLGVAVGVDVPYRSVGGGCLGCHPSASGTADNYQHQQT